MVPTECRPCSPAPDATTSGTTPRMKASEVIRIGRSRILAASTAASSKGIPRVPQLLGKFDNQDGVLAGQSHQHHQSDLAIDVILQAAQRLRRQRSQERHGNGQQHDEGQHETFILSRKGQVDHQRAQPEQDQRGASRTQFFERQASPLEGESLAAALSGSVAAMASSACPELKPGAAEPSISAERNKL